MTKNNVTETTEELDEKVIKINRINKVVKGGKRLSFRAFVVCGDNNGSVYYGVAKSREVPTAIRKAMTKAKKDLFKINTNNSTIPHEIIGKYGSTKVLLKPAKPGTGVIAGGSARALLECAGVKDVVAKCITSGSTINVAKATMNGLKQLSSVELESKKRQIKIKINDYKN